MATHTLKKRRHNRWSVNQEPVQCRSCQGTNIFLEVIQMAGKEVTQYTCIDCGETWTA